MINQPNPLDLKVTPSPAVVTDPYESIDPTSEAAVQPSVRFAGSYDDFRAERGETPTPDAPVIARGFDWRKVGIGAGIVLVVVAMAGASWWVLGGRVQRSGDQEIQRSEIGEGAIPSPVVILSVEPAPSKSEGNGEQRSIVDPATDSIATVSENQVNQENQANHDPDSDGITDSDELALGTNPEKADTDSDGLYDGDEVNIYKTDPLNPDTDGDSFLDGDEVMKGYNPKGAGMLYDFATERGRMRQAVPPAP